MLSLCHSWAARHHTNHPFPAKMVVESHPNQTGAERAVVMKMFSKILRSEFVSSALNRELHLQSLAHVDAKNPNAPFGSEDVNCFSKLISDFLHAKL